MQPFDESMFSIIDSASASVPISDRTISRAEPLAEFNFSAFLLQSDEKSDSPYPLLDHIYLEGVSRAIRDQNILTAPDFETIWRLDSHFSIRTIPWESWLKGKHMGMIIW